MTPSTIEFSSRQDMTSGDQEPVARDTLGVRTLKCTSKMCSSHSADRTCRGYEAYAAAGEQSRCQMTGSMGLGVCCGKQQHKNSNNRHITS